MTTAAAIILLCIGLPGLAVLIGIAIGSHLDAGSDDDFDCHP